MSTHGDVWKSPCGMMELRCGRWQDALPDVTECDAVITDPPYSERTHKGQRSSVEKRIANIEYGSMDGRLPSINAQWWAVFSDYAGSRLNEATLEAAGLYVFAPVIWAKTNATPRLAGDGPASAAEYITVARPRRRVIRSGSRPGVYIGISAGNESGVSFMGQKPMWLMRRIVCDYSDRGGLVVDSHAGSGTTLLAAAIEGRRAIGAEMDPATFDLAVKRLSKGYTPNMFAGSPATAENGELF